MKWTTSSPTWAQRLAPLLLLLLPLVTAAEDDSKMLKTRHNFYNLGREEPADLDFDELCILCHVPTKMTTARLLWGVRVPPDSYFSWSQKAGRGADGRVVLQSGRWAGSTSRCLSCHDGAIAFGIVYRPISSSISRSQSAKTELVSSHQSAPAFHGDFTTGKVMDMHPVSVPYPFGGIPSFYNGLVWSGLGTTTQWAEDPWSNGCKVYSDVIGAEPGPGNAGIECTSCHDPHGTGNPFFLRVPKAGSQLCMTCHRK